MKTLYLMCGLSFSGKTTLARKIVERLQCAYISLDNINTERGLWGGDGIPIEEWERTHALARERLATWMATGKDAVVDDVNNLRWPRPLAGRGEVQFLSHSSYLPRHPIRRTGRAASREPGHP
jgi:predicted kinase